MSKWIPVATALPPLTKQQRQPNEFGVQVLIWPPHKAGDGYSVSHTAFYGCRVTDEPHFYLYGKCIDVTHWQPLPEGP